MDFSEVIRGRICVFGPRCLRLFDVFYDGSTFGRDLSFGRGFRSDRKPLLRSASLVSLYGKRTVHSRVFVILPLL